MIDILNAIKEIIVGLALVGLFILVPIVVVIMAVFF